MIWRIVAFLFIFVSNLGLTYGQLQWSGYFDFEYLGKKRNFQQHHFSTFLQYNAELVTTFAEIEYEYAPELESQSDGTGVSSAKGTFLIERVWADLNFSEKLKLRMGKMLVPTWWQTYHYPNIVLTITRPQAIKNVFPGSDTGVMLHGSQPLKDLLSVNYKIWMGNGGGEVNSSQHNEDEESSYGSRVELETSQWIESSYMGLMYLSHPKGDAAHQRLDIYGVDLVLEHKGLGLNGAYHWNLESKGYYWIPSYRYELRENHSVTAYFAFDNLETQLNTDSKKVLRQRYFGLRYGYQENLSVKLEYLTDTNNEKQVMSQLAYFFN